VNTADIKTGLTTSICDLNDFEINWEPFPHVVKDEFIKPKHYAQLCRSFPTCPPSTGPSGFSLFWGDEPYERLLEEQPAWRALFNTFHSQQFIDWCKGQFAHAFQREGCQIDLSGARYVPYREDRIDKERGALRKVEHEPDELWVRMDIHQGRAGYSRPIHLDHARRLISLLIYMCDYAENRMVGGELFLHAADGLQTQHEPHTRIAPRHNLMVAFPCMNRSHHSVPKITSASAPRNYIQVHISSSVDVWPRKEISGRGRRALDFFKRRLKESPVGAYFHRSA
jgi:hypothetical protein